MKRGFSLIILFFILMTLMVFIFNLNLTSQQCINFKCHTISLPLYLKLLDFFDRHYNYKHLLKDIIKDTDTKEEKIMKIFVWTYKNIKRLPPGLPVIDDHIWYTIVRGYAVSDQFSDIFSTLCNYASIKAFFKTIYAKDREKIVVLSYVKLRDSWSIFDPYNGIYFKDKGGRFCKMEAIGSNNCRPIDIEGKPRPDIDYTIYLDDLLSVGKIALSRPNIQSPLNRLLFELRKLKK